MKTAWPLLHYELDDYTEPWGSESAPVVLFHHGLAGNGNLFRAWVPALADRFRVLRIDARGQGRTPKPAGYEWSGEHFVSDVLQLLNYLEIERVHWIGSSGGGIIGQYAAITAGERIASLALVATTPRFNSPTPDIEDWLAPLIRDDADEFFRQDLERRFGSGNPARTEWIINEILRTPTKTIEELHRWVVGVDLIDALPEISCPTLIVTGGLDTLTDLNSARLMEQGIPDARLHIIEGYPHNVGYTHPHLVAPLVRGFLDDIYDSRASRIESGGKRVSDERRVSLNDIQTISELARLPMTEARAKQLAGTLSGFLEKFERMSEIDVQDAEPPSITYETEARP